jgi:hypothetical protein
MLSGIYISSEIELNKNIYMFGKLEVEHTGNCIVAAYTRTYKDDWSDWYPVINGTIGSPIGNKMQLRFNISFEDDFEITSICFYVYNNRHQLIRIKPNNGSPIISFNQAVSGRCTKIRARSYGKETSGWIIVENNGKALTYITEDGNDFMFSPYPDSSMNDERHGFA